MKTLLVITLLVLLLKSGYCEDTSETSFQEDSAIQDDNEKDATQELTESSETSADANTQGINLKFKAGKGLVITLTPEGGAHDGNGAIYTRWGKRTCPGGSKTIYDGFAAGGFYSQKGNGANYLCMPRDPQYLSTTNAPWPSLMYGAEYESNNQIFGRSGTHNYNVPCIVCQAPRINKLVVPGKVSCPKSWTREYYGYLMTSHVNHWRSAVYECVDHTPDVFAGTQSNRDGALFYFTTVVCSYGLPCGPYVNRRAVTCAVCTK